MRLLVNCPSGESRLLVSAPFEAGVHGCVGRLQVRNGGNLKLPLFLQQVNDELTVAELKQLLFEEEGDAFACMFIV
jgi:hypothetical protein